MIARPKVSAFVVAFNSRGDVAEAVASLRAAAEEAGRELEVIVVDNASSDGTADVVRAIYPPVRLLANQENVGFGRANNQAFAVAGGTPWILMNPDARLATGALPALLEAFEGDQRLAAVGPSTGGGGTGQAESAGELPGLRSLAAHFLFINRLMPGYSGSPWRGWQLRRGSTAKLEPVGWLSGAMMVVRPEAIREVGGFDPAIFMYGEDLELGYRLGAAGWRLALVPGAGASHEIGASGPHVSVAWIDGIEQYLVRRDRSSLAIAAAMWVIAIGLAVRVAPGGGRGASGRHRARLRAGAMFATRRCVRRLVGRQ